MFWLRLLFAFVIFFGGAMSNSGETRGTQLTGIIIALTGFALMHITF